MVATHPPTRKLLEADAARVDPMRIAARTALVDLRGLAEKSRTPKPRGILDFAEQMVIVPTGRFANRRFRRERHPVASMALQLIDDGPWRRVAVTGPVQDGKSFNFNVIPLLHHLVELKHTVVFGTPDENTSREKYKRDFHPVVAGSPRLEHLLPRTGSGSQGAWSEMIALRNGATLRNMTAKGGDETRSGFTAQVFMGTEVDKMDRASGASRESDPVTQMENRTDSYKASGQAWTLLECTSSVPEGRIAQEFEKGTGTTPRLRCPHCGGHFLIERPHLVGWRDAKNVQEAKERARLACPGCGVLWDEEDRAAAIFGAVLAHRGQTVEADGTVVGPVPKTDTLSFRWTAMDSPFKSMADLAAKEWLALHADEQQKAALEKELCQFQWAVPYVDQEAARSKLTVSAVLQRAAPNELWVPGRVPRLKRFLVGGVDIGKWWVHWVVMAVFADRRRHVVDYGKIAVGSDEIDTPQAIELALHEFHALCSGGWAMTEPEDPNYPINDHDAEADGFVGCGLDFVGYDANYMQDAVCSYLRSLEDPQRHVASIGFGIGQQGYGGRQYREPRNEDKNVLLKATQCKVIRRLNKGVNQIEFDADHAKMRVHDALRIDPDNDGAMTLAYVEKAVKHAGFARQITAEQPEQVFSPGRGYVTKMIAQRKQNHHGDAAAIANVCGELCLQAYGFLDDKPADNAAGSVNTQTPAPESPEPPEPLGYPESADATQAAAARRPTTPHDESFYDNWALQN